MPLAFMIFCVCASSVHPDATFLGREHCLAVVGVKDRDTQREHLSKALCWPLSILRNVPLGSFEIFRGAEWNGIFRLTATGLKTNPFHSRAFHVSQDNIFNFTSEKLTQVTNFEGEIKDAKTRSFSSDIQTRHGA